MAVRLTLQLGDKSQWVKVFDPRDCTIFVACDSPPDIGVMTRVDLAIGSAGPKVILHGRVISRRGGGDATGAAGCSIAVGVEDREKINYLNGFVRGGLLNLRERRRVPVRLPVTYGAIEGPRRTVTRDINEEGVFIVTDAPLPEESEVHLRLDMPGRAEPVALVGSVQHTVVVEDDDVPGMGILFRFKDGEAAEFTGLIDELEKAFIAGTLPEELLL
jgi:hypothetical protein